jgi:hypothetical protein
LTEEKKAAHKHVENHLYDHCPVGAFQIGQPQVILKHREVTQQGNERPVDWIFLCVVEMDADDGERKKDTHPIGGVESGETIDDESSQAICLLKTHEDDKSADDEKQIDTGCPEAKKLFISLMVQRKMKEHYRQCSYTAKSVEWPKPRSGCAGCCHSFGGVQNYIFDCLQLPLPDESNLESTGVGRFSNRSGFLHDQFRGE